MAQVALKEGRRRRRRDGDRQQDRASDQYGEHEPPHERTGWSSAEVDGVPGASGVGRVGDDAPDDTWRVDEPVVRPAASEHRGSEMSRKKDGDRETGGCGDRDEQ